MTRTAKDLADSAARIGELDAALRASTTALRTCAKEFNRVGQYNLAELCMNTAAENEKLLGGRNGLGS